MASHFSQPPSPTLLSSISSERPLRIAVSWDQCGDEAVHFAGWLAHSLPTQVRVITTAPRPWSRLRSLSSKKYKKWFKNTAEKRTNEIRSALKEHVPRCAWDDEPAVFRDGKPRHKLFTEEIERFGADLVLLGSKPKAAKGRFLATSTADVMLHSAPASVGLTPRGVKLSKKGITRVNFAFLDTRESARATARGIGLASALALTLDVPLRIMAFSPTETYSYDEELADCTFVDEWNENSLALIDRAWDVVTHVAEELGIKDPHEQLKSFEVETRVSSGEGWDTVVDSQKWKKGDVLFLDSSPGSDAPKGHVNIGARTADFLRHAPVPVVVLKR